MKVQPVKYGVYSKNNNNNQSIQPTFKMRKYIGDIIVNANRSTMKRLGKIFKGATDKTIKEYSIFKNISDNSVNKELSDISYNRLKRAVKGEYVPYYFPSYTFKNYDPLGNDYVKDLQNFILF